MHQLSEHFVPSQQGGLLESFGETRPHFIDDLLDTMQQAETEFMMAQRQIATQTNQIVHVSNLDIVTFVLETIDQAFGTLSLPELLTVVSAVSHRQGHLHGHDEAAAQHSGPSAHEQLIQTLQSQFNTQTGLA